MKHWNYTDIPNTCQSCGYKTCSVPTYKRHVKYCSVPATPTETDSVGTSSRQESSPVSVDAACLQKCRFCNFSTSEDQTLQMHEASCDANDGEVKLEADATDGRCKENGDGEQRDDGGAKTDTAQSRTSADQSSDNKANPDSHGSAVELKKSLENSVTENDKKSPRTDSAVQGKVSVKKDSSSKKSGEHSKAKPSQSSPRQTYPEPKSLIIDGEVVYFCTQCDFFTADKKQSQSHKKLCKGQGKKYSCTRCEFACDDRLIWVRHKLQHDNSEGGNKTIYSCVECTYKTPLKKNFERHRICHNSEGKFKCSFCSYSSTGESAVRRHISTYHSLGETDTGTETPKDSKTSGSPSQVSKRLKLESPENDDDGHQDLPGKAKKASKNKPAVDKKTPNSAKSSWLAKELLKEPKSDEISKSKGKATGTDSDDSLSAAVESQEEDNGGIVWSCFICKLDFKRQCDMEEHTTAEHAINLKDCVMYSLGDNAATESLFELEQEQEQEQLHEDLQNANDENQLHCAFCDFKGRRLSDVRRHFENKHRQKLDRRGNKRPCGEEHGASTAKKTKFSKSEVGENPTILEKLLQNDDPRAVYKAIDGNASQTTEDIKADQKTKSKATSKTANKEAMVVVADKKFSPGVDGIEGFGAASAKLAGCKELAENTLTVVQNSAQKSDKEVDYLTSLMCTFCGYLGNNPGEVERHTKIHTGEKNYWCPCCSYKTIWKCDMKKHLEKFHPAESDTPERMRLLLHKAFRPDGKHTAEELGYEVPKRKEKCIKEIPTLYQRSEKAHTLKPLTVIKSPIRSDREKDVLAAIDSSKKLLKKAKKNLLHQKTVLPEQNNADATSENDSVLSLSCEVDEVIVMKNSGRLKDERCRPYKCSACGRRSNWKWDIKKHITEQHPTATLITLSKDEAQKSFAEMIRLHNEKQRLSGIEPGSHRLRIGTTFDQNSNESPTPESSSVISNNSVEINEMPPPQNPPSLASHARKNLLKGMIDLDKLKRFRCSGCIYRSNFRADVSRHVRKRHVGLRCPVVVMSAEAAAASLNSYETRWSLRKLDPSIVNDLVADPAYPSPASSSSRSSPAEFGEIVADGKSNLRAKPVENGRRSALGGSEGNSGADNVKRREKLAIEEDDLKCCTICPYVTEKSDVLKLHMSYHQPQARNGYSCSFCPYYVNTERLLDHHLQLHVSKVSLAVQRPELTFAPKVLNGTTHESKYICDKCPYVSRHRSDYWAHRRNHFEKATSAFKCTFCPYWTDEQRQLSQHSKLHAKSYFPRTFPPTKTQDNVVDCRCVFAEKINDNRLSCGKELQCPYCSYSISSVKLLRQHVVFHVSFSDAAKNSFFDTKYNDADNHLFVTCRNKPLENSSVVVVDGVPCDKPKNEATCSNSQENRLPIVLQDSESYERNLPSYGFLHLDAALRNADDADSIETMDTDLPELDKFSCGNSDLSDKRISPDFIEAELMEEAPVLHDMRSDNMVPNVEASIRMETNRSDQIEPVVAQIESVVEQPISESAMTREAPVLLETMPTESFESETVNLAVTDSETNDLTRSVIDQPESLLQTEPADGKNCELDKPADSEMPDLTESKIDQHESLVQNDTDNSKSNELDQSASANAVIISEHVNEFLTVQPVISEALDEAVDEARSDEVVVAGTIEADSVSCGAGDMDSSSPSQNTALASHENAPSLGNLLVDCGASSDPAESMHGVLCTDLKDKSAEKVVLLASTAETDQLGMEENMENHEVPSNSADSNQELLKTFCDDEKVFPLANQEPNILEVCLDGESSETVDKVSTTSSTCAAEFNASETTQINSALHSTLVEPFANIEMGAMDLESEVQQDFAKQTPECDEDRKVATSSSPVKIADVVRRNDDFVNATNYFASLGLFRLA